MLGFAPLATIPLAGSPLAGSGATGYVWALEGGEYNLAGGALSMTKDNVMQLGAGHYQIQSPGTFIARHRTYELGGGVYTLTGRPAKVFTSSFFYGDPEVFRVTPEVTLMRVLPEPRDMVSTGGVVESVATDDQTDAVVPRLRRT